MEVIFPTIALYTLVVLAEVVVVKKVEEDRG